MLTKRCINNEEMLDAIIIIYNVSYNLERYNVNEEM